MNERRSWVDEWETQHKLLEEVETLIEMQEENPSEDIEPEIKSNLAILEKKVDDLEFRRMFIGEMDARNALLTIHPGAGGTESQDWAEMLMRMYLRYCENAGFKTDIVPFMGYPKN